MTTTDGSKQDIGWAVLELMGHRRLAGYVREVEVAGAGMVRIDVPAADATEAGPWTATQFYSPSAVYCVTPTTRDIAVRAAQGNQPAPVSRWELPAAKPAGGETPAVGDTEGDREFDPYGDRDDDYPV